MNELLGTVIEHMSGQEIKFLDVEGDSAFIHGVQAEGRSDSGGVVIGTEDGEMCGHQVVFSKDQIPDLIVLLQRWVETRSFT